MRWLANHFLKRSSTSKVQTNPESSAGTTQVLAPEGGPRADDSASINDRPSEDRESSVTTSGMGPKRIPLDHGHRPYSTSPDAAVSVPLVGPVPLHEVLERRRKQHIEDALQGAIQRGDFDNLPGRGKPFPPHVLDPANDRLDAGTVMLNAGFVPRWVELRQEIERDTAACLAIVWRTEHFPPTVNRNIPVDQVRTYIANIREKARLYNLIVPTLSLQRSIPDLTALEQRVRRAAGVDSD